MAGISNYAAVAAARNGATTHTVAADGTGGSVVSGVGFTPTSGRLLVCVVEASVTSTTPTGWTLPTGGSAVNNTGLYVFWRSASGASADQFATTHNVANYPAIFHFLEFLAGSSFVSATGSTGVASAGAGPTLSGLTGSNWLAAAIGIAMSSGQGSAASNVWSGGTEQVDTSVVFATTDGYGYSLTFDADWASATYSRSSTVTFTGGTAPVGNMERLVFAVNAAAAATGKAPPFPHPTTRQLPILVR